MPRKPRIPRMPRKRIYGKDIPESKRIKNNPYAVKGHKVGALDGGVIVSKPNADGSITRITIDEHGNRHTHVDRGDEPPAR
jgi:hypothetical protein